MLIVFAILILFWVAPLKIIRKFFQSLSLDESAKASLPKIILAIARIFCSIFCKF